MKICSNKFIHKLTFFLDALDVRNAAAAAQARKTMRTAFFPRLPLILYMELIVIFLSTHSYTHIAAMKEKH